jgi:hypothetical protein
MGQMENIPVGGSFNDVVSSTILRKRRMRWEDGYALWTAKEWKGAIVSCFTMMSQNSPQYIQCPVKRFEPDTFKLQASPSLPLPSPAEDGHNFYHLCQCTDLTTGHCHESFLMQFWWELSPQTLSIRFLSSSIWLVSWRHEHCMRVKITGIYSYKSRNTRTFDLYVGNTKFNT